MTLKMTDEGVAYREKSRGHGAFLPWSLCHRQFSDVVTRHRQFWTVINCDPSCNSKYGTYWSDHAIYAGGGLGLGLRGLQCNVHRVV